LREKLPLADNRRITEFARNLRTNQTDAEKQLWWSLRELRSQGIKFRRQVPIAPYIVDFCNERTNLIVEIDGSQHQKTIEYDHRRTEFLELRGYRVVRFTNLDVLMNVEGVILVILTEMDDR
jgi:very-short-patch-repair endonuclease